jgi:sensor histidine kinase regulating citrate/malate metabolism
MTDDNDHLAKLVAARARMVAERREVARALTEKYKRGQTNEMRELLVQIQTTIDAIDRAIADEKNIASAHSPPTAVGFIDPQKQ